VKREGALVPDRRPVRDRARVPVLRDGDHGVQDQDRVLQPAINPYWFGKNSPTLANASFLFHHTPYLTLAARTPASSGSCVVAITLVLACPAGYALARLAGAWARASASDLPHLPRSRRRCCSSRSSRVIKQAHLTDSIWSLVLVYPSFTVPVLDVAADGVLQDDPAGARGRRARRRCVAPRRRSCASSSRSRSRGSSPS
jgi:hypothetical protein